MNKNEIHKNLEKEDVNKLIDNSLKSAETDDEHSYFLQQNNIYWETGHRTYIPFFHFLIHKYTNKIIDDQVSLLIKISIIFYDVIFLYSYAIIYF